LAGARDKVVNANVAAEMASNNADLFILETASRPGGGEADARPRFRVRYRSAFQGMNGSQACRLSPFAVFTWSPRGFVSNNLTRGKG